MSLALKRIKKRQSRNILDDYYSQLWFRYHKLFFGSLIFEGRKLGAFNTLASVRRGLKLKESVDPFRAFLVSMMMVTPHIVLLPLRMGGRTVGVPMPITEKKKVTVGVKFVIKMLKERSNSVSVKSLVDTLVSSIYGQGPSVERKNNVHKTGGQNRHLLARVFPKMRKVLNKKKNKKKQ